MRPAALLAAKHGQLTTYPQPSLLPCPQALDHASYWHAGGRPHMAPLEAGGPTPSQMQAYLAAELERAHVRLLPIHSIVSSLAVRQSGRPTA